MHCIGKKTLKITVQKYKHALPFKNLNEVMFASPVVYLLPHSLIFFLGLAEQFQDVDGLWLCNTIGPSQLRPLWWLSLGMVCFLFYNPRGQWKLDTSSTHLNVMRPVIMTVEILTWPLAEQCVDSPFCHRTKYCRYPLQENKYWLHITVSCFFFHYCLNMCNKPLTVL